MTNNDILRNLRYIFNYSDLVVHDIFKLAGKTVAEDEQFSWFTKGEKAKAMADQDLAYFLNGLIVHHRGKRDDKPMTAEEMLTNNIILRKIKIALNLKDFEILDILDKADFQLGKHELSAFFRKPGQRQYRLCKDQVLRNFLFGLKLKYRDHGDTKI